MSFQIPFRSVCGALFLLSLPASARADVKLPAIFGDHMVLQQEKSVPVWGTADAGEKVTVTVGTHAASAVAAPDGAWRVNLDPFPDGSAPAELTVQGKNTLKFQDVLIGEVWLCSGQSNMELPLGAAHNAKTEIPQARDPSLRLFVVKHKLSLQPLTVLEGSWELCTPATAREFSAAAYFFGRDLRAHLHRPIGLIASCWGGTTAQAWTSLSGLQKPPAVQRYLDLYQKNLAAFPHLSDGYEARQAAYVEAAKQWQTPENVAAERAWLDATHKAQAAHQPGPPRNYPPRPTPPPVPGGDERSPANLFNGMIAPLIPYAIKGVIWYQGEYNTDDPMEYYVLFPRLIEDWRAKWGAGDFPFLFVQLPPIITSKDDERALKFDSWDIVREAQAKALSLPNTGMAVAMDVGGRLHPAGKLYVGERLALIARKTVYGDRALADSGPVYAAMKVEPAGIRLSFRQPDGGLVIGSSPMPNTAEVQPKESLAGFEIAGADKVWSEAQAKIDGDTVIVSSPQVAAPVAVRYGGGNGRFDAECNLYNKAGLPAPPFRTDDWQDIVPANARTNGRVFPDTLFPLKPVTSP